jgi:hypothetical protein
MKNKGILSGILIICVMLSTIAIPAFGAQEDSRGLEKAIVAAKNIIEVPEDYTNFTHTLSERETINGKIRIWNFNWAEKDGKNGSVSASVGEDGFLYDYNKYTGIESSNDNGLAKITKDQAQILAENFLEKAIPTYAGQMKKVDNNVNDISSEEYNFTYQRFVNETPVNFITINIGVNKYSGEVTSFNDWNPEIQGIEYQTLDGIIDLSAAEKAYVENLGINLKYYSYYDYKQNKINIFAGYSIDDNRNNAIDAKTGQVVSLSKEGRFYNYNKDNIGIPGSENSSVKTEQKLTKEEIDAINNVTNLITKEKAESIIRETSDIITSDIKVNDESLNKNYIDDGYTWSISFEGGYGEVDAKSGEIISLHFYNYDNTTNNNISEAQAQNIAENFLEKVTPDKFSQTKYEDIKNSVLKIDFVQGGDISSYNFVRQVNGIEFSSNSLSVEVDKTKGKIIGYDNKWYENVSFPDISQAMNKETAFNKIKDLAGFELQYSMLDNNKVGLIYNFRNTNEDYIIDPVNGGRLDFTGQAYKDNKLPEYSDISGHWCEKTVKELLDNGYYINGEKFNPNMNITQINFFKYIYSPVKNNYADDSEFYDMLIQNGIIKKEEKSPNSFVSNQDAAKFIIRYLGYDKLAMHPEIFSNPFKDNIEEQYKGYASMCYVLNIIKGDKNGNFNESHNISNAEAAVIIYNLISNNTK